MRKLPLHSIIGLPILFLFGLTLYFREVPFRGEHWAMLHLWVKSQGWFEGFSQVVNMACFGEKRFQPLNSSPMMIGFELFGMRFLPNYWVSIFLHLILGVGVLRLLEALRESPKSRLSELLRKYPLEYAVFLALFCSFEVLFWTFYQYIQIAVALGVFALAWYLRNENAGDRLRAYLFLVLAALFYEPLLCFLAVLWGVNLLERKNRLLVADLILPGVILLLIGSQYLSGAVSKPVTIPPDVSRLNGILLQPGHDRLFQAPGAHFKPLFLLYNLFLLIVHVLMTSLLPAYANKTNLFEMVPVPPSLETLSPLFILVGGAIAAYWLVRAKLPYKRFRSHAILAAMGVLCSSVIIWGRPGAGHYASVQYRYGFVILPLLFVGGITLLLRVKSRKVYAGFLVYLMVVNLASSAFHAYRLKKSFNPLSELAKVGENETPEEAVARVSKALMQFEIEAPGHDAFLIYNGRGCLAGFYGNQAKL